jgi:GNAT superfamily N-acetyltransferase
MMTLRKLKRLKDPEELSTCIQSVNAIRGHYQWSKRTYDETNIENVYAILDEGKGRGFIECNYENLEIWREGMPHLMLSELHIAPSQQGKGYGTRVLNHLLSKGLDIELMVANENEPMLKLVSKFSHRLKHDGENLRTFILIAPTITDNRTNKTAHPTAGNFLL